ncbi:MAG: tol-pal system protein YbgF [Thermodesulfobacteriota bacterium]
MRMTLLMLIGALALSSGCAMRKDMMVLEGRLAQLEMQLGESEKQMSRFSTQLESSARNREEAMSDTRGSYASLRSQVDALREELNLLNGQMEELRYSMKQSSSGGVQLEERFNRLDRTITQNTDRIIRIETHLGLEAGKAPPERSTGKTPVIVPENPPPVAAESAVSSDADETELYESAKRDFDQGNMTGARQGFKKLLQVNPRSENADNAQFWIAESYYQEKWYEKAILEYHEVIKKYPNGNKVPAALLKQGLAFQQIGDKKNAKLVLQELIRKFPQTNEAVIAKQKQQGL